MVLEVLVFQGSHEVLLHQDGRLNQILLLYLFHQVVLQVLDDLVYQDHPVVLLVLVFQAHPENRPYLRAFQLLKNKFGKNFKGIPLGP